MSACPALISQTTATIAGGIVAIASALLPASRPEVPDLEAHARRAVLHWQQGDIAGARDEFGEVLRLKRRQADVLVEEI
jgi:Flp pilus assembly protein TadD